MQAEYTLALSDGQDVVSFTTDELVIESVIEMFVRACVAVTFNEDMVIRALHKYEGEEK